MKENLLKRILELAKQGGHLALSHMADTGFTLKPDNSVLTKADMAVSEWVRENLQDLLATKEHVLIDEEDDDKQTLLNQATLEEIPYIWVMDPIDGTRGFSNKLPSFGFSLGLLKDLQPFLSAVYLPILNELFYCDGSNSYYVKHAFTAQEQKITLTRLDQEITGQSVFWGNDVLLREYQWDYSLCQVMHYSCAVIDLCYPAVGRGVGCFFNSYIWDFAGSWPIFEAAGLKLRNLKTGEPVNRIHVDLFQDQGSNLWRFKEHHILSSEKNFALIKNNIKSRDSE